jgi:hypothetical protein
VLCDILVTALALYVIVQHQLVRPFVRFDVFVLVVTLSVFDAFVLVTHLLLKCALSLCAC